MDPLRGWAAAAASWHARRLATAVAVLLIDLLKMGELWPNISLHIDFVFMTSTPKSIWFYCLVDRSLVAWRASSLIGRRRSIAGVFTLYVCTWPHL